MFHIHLKSAKARILALIILTGISTAACMLLLFPPKAYRMGSQVQKDDARFITRLLAQNLALGVQAMAFDDGAAIKQALNALDDSGSEATVRQSQSDSDSGSVEDLLTMDLDLGGDTADEAASPPPPEKQETAATKPEESHKENSDLILTAILVDKEGAFLGGLHVTEADTTKARKDISTIELDETQTILTAYSPLKADGETIGYLRVEFSKSHVLKAVSDFRIFAAIASSILLAAALGAGIWITNGIINPIIAVIRNLGETSEVLKGSSSRAATISQNQSDGANRQASSLEEISATLEEMAAITKQNADNVATAENSIKETQERVSRGTQAAEKMSDAINRIQKSSEETAHIIRTIDEIAFQTNLLALNAAVEAARAGDAGRGFAVVADEVRQLAQRCAEAAKNTSILIEQSQQSAKDGVEVREEVVKVLNTISASTTEITGLIGEISTASQEQSRGIEQVNVAAADMNHIVQQNVAGAVQSAEDAGNLNRQSTELATMVQSLGDIIGLDNTDNQTSIPRSQRSQDFDWQPSGMPVSKTKNHQTT